MKNRKGQALIEFAIISFVLAAIVAGILGIVVLGLGSFQNNIATENAGRLLDSNPVLIKQNFVTHFSADGTDPFTNADDFENITARQVYRFLNEYPTDGVYEDAGMGIERGPVLYDESWLVMTPEEYLTSRNSDDNPLDLPQINLSLLGQYVFDPDLVPDGETAQGAYRFPGAVVRNTTTMEQTVLVPILPGPESSGIDRTFNVTSTDGGNFYPVSQDWVAPVVIGRIANGNGFEFQAIIFLPSQPGSMINLDVVRNSEGELVSQTPVEADDSAVASTIGAPPAGYTLEPATSNNPAFGASTSRGQYGLGETFAFTTTVRPFRVVFETSSVFRMGAKLNPILTKYEADSASIPFPALLDESDDVHTTDLAVEPFTDPNAYEDLDDQALNLDVQVIDRNSADLRRFFVDEIPVDPPFAPPASADNDFVHDVLWLLPNDDGVWRVSVSAEFQVFDDPADPADDNDEWVESHELELRLYKNGAFERLIARQVVTEGMFDPADANPTVVLLNDVLTEAVEGDVFQVRVFTRRPLVDPTVDPPDPATDPTYDVHLTGAAETNWISFERIQD
ncbi:MAG: hypothetical protein AAF483_05880 [Planctomycetota bacterium]